MAIDTAAKRSSVLDHEEVWTWGTPLPDGAIGQGDRQHSVWSYSGILAVAIVAGPWRYIAIGTHQPGSAATGTHQPGSVRTGTHQPGSAATGTI